MIDETLLRVLPWRGLEWDAGPAFHRRWTDYLRSRLAEIEAALAGMDAGTEAGTWPYWRASRHPGARSC